MIRLILSLFIGLFLLGCTYHYHLHITIGPGGSPGVEEGELPESLTPIPQATKPNLIGPKADSGPMVIDPGQFTASQTKGGNMVNVILNINSAKPTEVTTDTSLSGVPGL